MLTRKTKEVNKQRREAVHDASIYADDHVQGQSSQSLPASQNLAPESPQEVVIKQGGGLRGLLPVLFEYDAKLPLSGKKRKIAGNDKRRKLTLRSSPSNSTATVGWIFIEDSLPILAGESAEVTTKKDFFVTAGSYSSVLYLLEELEE